MSRMIMGFENCDVGFEQAHIHGLNLDVNKGDFISIVGPTGVGKTTLLRLISGVDKKGRQPRVLSGQWKRQDSMTRGIVFQSLDQLLPWKTALENVLLPALSQDVTLSGFTQAGLRSRAESLLEMVGLGPHKEKYPVDLSGGMRQRVAIARAMLLKPELLLMDEPFGSLDAITRKNLQAMLRTIHASRGTTILFVTHDVDEALGLSNKILALDTRGRGHVLEKTGEPDISKIKERIMKQLEL